MLAAGAAWWVAAAPEREPGPAYTDPPVVVAPDQIAPEPPQNGLDSYLPEFDRTIERQVGTLGVDETYVLRIPTEKNDDYLLQYVCVGPGDLSVRIKGTSEGELLYMVDCGGNLSTLQFVAADTVVLVEVHRAGPEPAEVGVQVIDVQ